MWGYNKNTSCSPKYMSQCKNNRTATCSTRKPRSCSPTTRVTDCSDLDYHQRCFSAPVCKKPEWKDWSITRNRCCPEKEMKISKIQPGSDIESVAKPRRTVSKSAPKEKPVVEKPPEPKTEVKVEVEETPNPPECEYVHFLLQITEDILRNNLYTEEQMDKLFESYIEANKKRLDETRMRAQIDQLRKELNLPLSPRCPACMETENRPPKEKRSASTQPDPIDIIEEEPLDEETPLDEDGESNEAPMVCPTKKRECSVQTTEEEVVIKEEDLVCEVEICKEYKCNTEVCEQFCGTKAEDIDEDVKQYIGEKIDETLYLEEEAERKLKIEEETKQRLRLEEETKLRLRLEQEAKLRLQFEEEAKRRLQLEEEAKLRLQLEEEARQRQKLQQEAELKLNDPLGSLMDAEESKKTFKFEDNVYPCKAPALCKTKLEDGENTNPQVRFPSGSSSMVKIKNKNEADEESQIIPYTPPEMVEDSCICNITLQRTALKIQVEDENEEYVLVDGPVCMPRSMLETRTVPVLVQNVSSMVLPIEHNPSASYDPGPSKVNLFHRPSEVENTRNDTLRNSVSAQFTPDDADGDYDLTPEREVVEEVPTVRIGTVVDEWEPEEVEETLLFGKTEPEEDYEVTKPLKCIPEACPQNLSDKVPASSDGYHLLLVDVSTSISECKVHSQKNTMIPPPPPRPVPMVDEEFRRLLEDDYEKPADSATDVPEITSNVSFSIDSDPGIQPSISDELEEPMDDSSELLETTDTEIHQDTLIPGILEKLHEEEHVIPKVEEPPQMIKQRPSILTSGRSTFLRALDDGQKSSHEGPKVRYSLVHEGPLLPNIQHMALINKLDELPEPPKPKPDIEQIAIKEKMKEFRAVDEEDAANKRFQISNQDKFEIRRVSLIETQVHENEEKNKEKTKTTCCGLGQSRKRGGSFSSDFLR